jgi:hypothetical protein
MLQITVVLGRRWRKLSAKERTRFAAILRKSRGRPGNLSARERYELGRLVARLDPRGAGREVAALYRGRRRRRRRR